MSDESERLSKRVARMQSCSRAQAEQLIAGGKVRVDGVVISVPQHRVNHEAIVIDLLEPSKNSSRLTLVFNKPAGAVIESQDCQMPVGLMNITPLETGAEGLVVLTKDARTMRQFSDEAIDIEHEVVIEINGPVSPDALQFLRQPFTFEAQTLPAAKVSVAHQNTASAVTGLRFAQKGLQPGQILEMCEAAALDLIAMKRIRIGRLALRGLSVGTWRELSAFERF